MISSTSILAHYQSQNLSVKPSQAQSETSSHVNKMNTSTTGSVSISNNARGLADIGQDISSRYDVTNLSEKERISMSHELLEHKLISPGQHAVMSFPMQEMVSKMPGYEGTYDPNKKENYLQQSIDQLAFTKGGGASAKEVQSKEQLISFLENLKSLREG